MPQVKPIRTGNTGTAQTWAALGAVANSTSRSCILIPHPSPKLQEGLEHLRRSVASWRTLGTRLALNSASNIFMALWILQE
jgi:hypothetical protein